MTPVPELPADTDRWRARPLLATVVRFSLLVVPLAASGLAVLAVDRVAPSPTDQRWLWVGLALAAALAVGVVVERGVRRFLPLPVLLRLDLLFPDRAPSRFRVAREAVSRSQRRLERTPSGTAEQVLRLIGALGAHDRRTRGHCERVRVLTDLLAAELRLDEPARDRLRWAALLHDLGKLDVPVEVLNKPSRLSSGELATVRTHPEVGAALAAPLMPWLGEWGLGIVEHHEKYDGTGYPAGLARDGISRAGRMVGLVDAFETMTAARTYKKAMATAAAREELARCSGTHFDPTCVRAFLAVPLPRLLWAMGPTSFLLQVPFLRMLAEAGRISASAGGAAGPAAAGIVGAAVIVAGGAADVRGGPDAEDRPQQGTVAMAAQALGPVAVAHAVAVSEPADEAVTASVPVIGPPTGLEPADEGPVDAAPETPEPEPAPVQGPSTGLPPNPTTDPEPAAETETPLPDTNGLPVPDPAGIEPVLEPIVRELEPVLDPVVPELDPVLETLDPVLETLDPVVETLDPVVEALDPILDTLEPVVTTLDPALETLEPVVETLEPVMDVVEPVVETLDPVLETLEPVVDTLAPVLDGVTDPLEPILVATEPVLEAVDPILDATDPVVDLVDSTLPLDTLDEPLLETTEPILDVVDSSLPPLGGLL